MTDHAHTIQFRWGAAFAVLSAVSSGIMLPLGKPNAAAAGPAEFLLGICAVAALVSAPALLRANAFQQLFASRKVGLGFVAHVGFSAAALFLLWTGTSRINPAVAGVLSNLHVIFAVVLSFAVLGEPIGRRTLAGGVLIVGGLFVMRGSETGIGQFFMEFSIDWMLVIASAALFALSDLAIKMTALKVDMYSYLAQRNLLLTVIFGLMCLGAGESVEWHRLLEMRTIATGILGIICSRLFFNLALQKISLSRASLIFQVQPLFVLFFAYLLYRELPTSDELLGGMVIMSGVTLVLLK
jgi:drug/metabolite transporter (DMT)-like permease